ncbi:MAG: hypothetical protein HOW73_49390 [Polyangiaceae bacterium]|nr:hypothetical protein [Polyangiaceae bacterium]
MKRLAHLALVASISSFCFTGCKPTTEDVCARFAECEDRGDVEDCNADLNQAEASAKEAECEGEFDAWIECLDGVGDVCDDDNISAACDEKLAAVEQCGVDF